MSRILELAAERISTRDIRTVIYSSGESHIVAEGWLTDIRLVDWYKFTGERNPAGTLHDLGIVLLIKIPSMVIEDLEVVIKTIPREDCILITDTLRPVIGMSITGGFSSKVRQTVGGVKGCTHLVHLITTMASAVMQGMFAYYSMKIPDRKKSANTRSADNMRLNLKNSCITWREDGELYKKLSSLVEKSRAESND